MSKIDYAEMGKRIKAQRKKYKLTQEELAEKVDIVPTYVSGIERGKSICSLAVAVKIAEELDLNLDHMIRGINISNAESTFSELLKNIPKENRKLFTELCINIADTLSKK